MTVGQRNLAKLLSPDASAAIRKRGAAYFRSGHVGDLMFADNAVFAIVHGTDDYEVGFLAVPENNDELALRASCTCPYFYSGDICKHIWATVLKIERSPRAIRLLGLDEAREIYLDPAYDDDEFPDVDAVLERHDLDHLDEMPMIETGPASRFLSEGGQDGVASRNGEAKHTAGTVKPNDTSAATRSNLKHRSEPPWLDIIKKLTTPSRSGASEPNPWPPEKQLLYLIDTDATLTGQGVVVNIATRQLKRDGQWSKPRHCSVSSTEVKRLPDLIDRRVFTLLNGAKSSDWQYGYDYRYGGDASRIRLNLEAQRPIVELMARTGRCFLLSEDDQLEHDTEPVQWDAGEPWKLKLLIERDRNKKKTKGKAKKKATAKTKAKTKERHYVLRGWFERGNEQLDIDQPLLLTAGGLLFGADDTIAALHEETPFGWVLLLREHGEIPMSEKEIDHLLEHVVAMPNVPDLTLPEELQIKRMTLAPRPRLRIDRPQRDRWGYSYGGSNTLHAVLSFDYDGQVIDWSSPQAGVLQHEVRRYIERDSSTEAAARETAIGAGFRLPNADAIERGADLLITASKLVKAVNTLVEQGWHVEAEGTIYRQSGSVSLDIRESGIDWFELEGEADFDGQVVALPALLESLGSGEKFIKLDDGSVGVLPQEWIERYARLSSMGQSDDDGRITLRSTQIGLIDALIDQMPEISFDEQVAKARKKLKRFTKVRPRNAPRGFSGELRPYQKDGLGWMHFLRQIGFGGCLADDMGLGKTVQVLALLEQRRQQRRRDKRRTPPSLVVVPRSLLYNWRAEAERFTPKLRVLDHVGQERHAVNGHSSSNGAKHSPRDLSSDAIAHFDEYDVILTTYGTLRRDIPAMKDYRFDYIILDEAQAIKNAATASAKAARLLQADHRLALSGTPIENHLGELWSLFEFLNPGMLGRDQTWITRNGGMNGSSHSQSPGMAMSGLSTTDLLARAVQPFVLRRTKQQVATDLPEKTEQTSFCELDPKQRKLYEELRDYYRASLLSKVESVGLNRSKIMVLEALLRLRQAACHPALIDEKHAKAPSAKLDALMPLLTEVMEEGHKALVFSQFTSFLSIIRQRLDAEKVKYAYLDGRTRKRAERVREFQDDPDCKLFLISLKAGGLGLNLTAAEYVFLLDPWWNPAVEAQAIDRAHRIGQTKNVFAYRLIARDTVEEKVLELQHSKRKLAESIIRADANLIRTLTVDDLRVLLS